MNGGRSSERRAAGDAPDRYKWIALSNTTLGILMAVINQSIVIIALPAIFRGIHLNPLIPSNTSYLLWMLLSFMVVMAVLVVSLGRVGDIFGRVRMYNLGFAIFTVGSILLSVTWLEGSAGAMWMIVMRVVQGIGAAFLMANSSAILTDAFPAEERGLALGINMVAAIAGSFIGLVLGGVLAPVAWRLVFLVSVPFGLFGTVWAYLKLEERGIRTPAKIDWWGNVTFAVGLIAVLVGITYGILPYGGHNMGWTAPGVIAALAGGIVMLARVRGDRAARRGADVPPRPVQDPGVQRRERGHVPGRAVPRRPDVHADPVAAGDLAARCTATASRTPRCGRASTCCRCRSGSWSPGRSPVALPTTSARGRSRPGA